jgi:hypothetical protein
VPLRGYIGVVSGLMIIREELLRLVYRVKP